MRAVLVVLALAGAASSSIPASAAAQEIRIGGIFISGERTYDLFDTPRSETGTVRGVDVLLRAKGIGLAVRSLSGDFGDQPQVISADARVLFFPPAFTIFGGAGRRVLWSELGNQYFDIGLAGISSTIKIGGSGLRTNVTGAYYIPILESVDRIKGGMEGEASILYTIPKIPIYLQLGYRTEVFTSKTERFEAPEEVRGVRLGAGIQFGGR